MAKVVEFATWYAETLDWTPGERAQLRDVGLQMAAVADGFEVVFGRTEEGDPWCVVTDAAHEVVLHVARIGGRFVVHSAPKDQVVEGTDLLGTVRRLVGDVVKDRRGMLLPFDQDWANANAIIAFILAATLRGGLDRLVDEGPDATPLPGDPGLVLTEEEAAALRAAEDHAAAMAGGQDHYAGSGRTAHGTPLAAPDAASPPTAARAPANDTDAPAGASPATIQGGQRLAGIQVPPAPAADNRNEEAMLQGASPPVANDQATVLKGGDGDDRIAMSANSVAAGGDGADVFTATRPVSGQAADGAPKLLGVIADFNAAQGDRLEIAGATVVSDTRVANVLENLQGLQNLGGFTTTAAGLVGRHIGFDFNGDGKEDAYVLVTNASAEWLARLEAAVGVTPSGNGSSGSGPISGPVSSLFPVAEPPALPPVIEDITATPIRHFEPASQVIIFLWDPGQS